MRRNGFFLEIHDGFPLQYLLYQRKCFLDSINLVMKIYHLYITYYSATGEKNYQKKNYKLERN